MDHAKKILLTEPLRTTRPLRSPLRTTRAVRSPLDDEIAKVLRSNLPEDVKAKSYSTVLRRYRLYDERKPEQDPFARMSNQMTPAYMLKTIRLLKFLKPYITFNNEFELVHDGTTIPLSNVVELAENAVQQKSSGPKPIGWTEFADVLKRARAPRELIPNIDLWSYMTPKSRKTVKKRRWDAY